MALVGGVEVLDTAGVGHARRPPAGVGVPRVVVGQRGPRIERPHVPLGRDLRDGVVRGLERAAGVAAELCVVARDAVDLQGHERVPEELRAAGHHLRDGLESGLLIHGSPSDAGYGPAHVTKAPTGPEPVVAAATTGCDAVGSPTARPRVPCAGGDPTRPRDPDPRRPLRLQHRLDRDGVHLPALLRREPDRTLAGALPLRRQRLPTGADRDDGGVPAPQPGTGHRRARGLRRDRRARRRPRHHPPAARRRRVLRADRPRHRRVRAASSPTSPSGWSTAPPGVGSGRGVWRDDSYLPEGQAGVSGEYFYAPDGFLFGSPHFSMYRRDAIEDTVARWGVGFQSAGRDISDAARKVLEDSGRWYFFFDTGKILNILLQHDGHRLEHFEHRHLMHIGGMSHYLSQPDVPGGGINDPRVALAGDPPRGRRGTAAPCSAGSPPGSPRRRFRPRSIRVIARATRARPHDAHRARRDVRRRRSTTPDRPSAGRDARDGAVPSPRWTSGIPTT